MQTRKRTRQRSNKKADLILTADWHLRDDQPVCRTDNYFQTQEKKIEFVCELQEKHDCSVIHAGDLFNKAKASPKLEILAINTLPSYFYTIAGQHDLPNHNLNKIDESSLGVLFSAKMLNPGFEIDIYFAGLSYGDDFSKIPKPEKRKYEWGKILVAHTFIQKPRDKQDKIIGGSAALSFLKKHKDFKLIVTGDNHKTFVVEHEGRLLVNPGSMMRMTAGQTNHKPCVFLYYADTNTVQPVYLPIEDGVISREHIEEEEKKDKRFQAFVQRLNTDYEVSLSFEKNMKTHITQNKVRKGVSSVIWEAMS
jgi:DNA repair exonuclease SbcCD nuclease subunit